MAFPTEEFHEAFGLGSDQRYIGTGDADGVAMAALKALYEIVAQQQAQIEALTEMLSSGSTKHIQTTLH